MLGELYPVALQKRAPWQAVGNHDGDLRIPLHPAQQHPLLLEVLIQSRVAISVPQCPPLPRIVKKTGTFMEATPSQNGRITSSSHGSVRPMPFRDGTMGA